MTCRVARACRADTVSSSSRIYKAPLISGEVLFAPGSSLLISLAFIFFFHIFSVSRFLEGTFLSLLPSFFLDLQSVFDLWILFPDFQFRSFIIVIDCIYVSMDIRLWIWMSDLFFGFFESVWLQRTWRNQFYSGFGFGWIQWSFVFRDVFRM